MNGVECGGSPIAAGPGKPAFRPPPYTAHLTVSGVVFILASLVSDLAQNPQPSSTPSQSTTRLTVFLDCTTEGCYEEFLREEVDFVEYVRDRTDADVHVLITRAQTGSRGLEYTLSFIGQRRFEGTDRTLTVVSQSATPKIASAAAWPRG